MVSKNLTEQQRRNSQSSGRAKLVKARLRQKQKKTQAETPSSRLADRIGGKATEGDEDRVSAPMEHLICKIMERD